MPRRSYTFSRFGLGVTIVLILLAITPYTPHPTEGGKILLIRLSAFILSVMLIWTTPLRDLWSNRPRILLALFTSLLIVMAISTVRAHNLGLSLSELTTYFALYLLFLISSLVIKTPSQAWRLIAVTIIASGIASLYGFLQYIGLDPFPWHISSPGRLDFFAEAPSTYGNPNYASHANILCVILTIGLIRATPARWPVVALFLQVVHLSLSGTRGSLLALGLALTLLVLQFLIQNRLKNTLRALFALLLLMSLVIFAASISVAVITSFRTGSPYPDDLSIQSRFHSYDTASGLIRERPLRGWGLGAFRIEEARYWTDYEKEIYRDKRTMNTRVHNEPLEFAVEAGVIASFILISIFIFGVYYGCTMSYNASGRSRRCLGATLAALLFAAFIDGICGFNLHVPVSETLFFVYAGVLAGVWTVAHEGARTVSKPPNRHSVPGRLLLTGALLLALWTSAREFGGLIDLQNARAALFRNDTSSAQVHFENAVKGLPYDWNIHSRLGSIASQRGDYPGAMGHLEKAYELNPSYIPTLLLFAKSKFNLSVQETDEHAMEQIDDVILSVRRAQPFFLAEPEFYEVLGSALLRKVYLANLTPGGSTMSEIETERIREEAEQNLEIAIQTIRTPGPRLFRFLASSYVARGKMGKAVEMLARAVLSSPGDDELWSIFFQIADSSNNHETLLYSIDHTLRLASQRIAEPEKMSRLRLLKARTITKIDTSPGRASTSYESLQ